MKQLTVAARLVLGFGIIIVLSFAIGVTAYVSATKLAADTEHVYRDGVLASQHLALAQTSLWELRFGVANYAALPKPEARRKIVAAGPTLFQTMDASLAELFSSEKARKLRDWSTNGTPEFCKGCSFHIPLSYADANPAILVDSRAITGAG